MVVLGIQSSFAQYKLDTICYAGPSNIFTDIVFLGDGFTADELDVFVASATNHADQFFNKVPWSYYRNMFNVFYVKTASNESGAGMTPDAPIDNFYGVCFGTSGVDRMPWPTKWSKVYEVLNAVKPDYDMVAIIVNSEKYGGGGGGKFICFSMNASSIETLRHEAGHAFGNLADEYWYRGREAANMTQNITPVKWQQWMGTGGVGTYRYSENTSDAGYSWYRPHQNCLMRYLNRQYCPVCREAIIEKIHETSKNIKGFTPANEAVVVQQDEDVIFKLDLLKPEPNTLRTEWLLDNSNVARQTEQFSLNVGALNTGTHTLSATVEDTTLLVLTANHTSLHAQTVTWQIDVQQPTGINSITASEHHFTVGPLPFSDKLTFSSKQQQNQPIRMELLDVDGRKAASKTFKDDTNCTLQTGHLKSGIYVIRIFQNGKLIYTRKITKRNDLF